MDTFVTAISARLEQLRAQGLWRELRCIQDAQGPIIDLAGGSLLNFSSNDYLGLANLPVLKEAAASAAQRYGAGSGASRLVCGSLAIHHRLEETLAEFKGTEAALSFSSGYATALGTVPSLVGAGDFVVIDRLAHACIVDAARLSRATLRVFAHNDLGALEKILKWIDSRPRPNHPSAQRPRVLIITDSVFSMDGDHAPLRELVEIKERYGAWLMVDEAHATGLYGAKRRGLAEHFGVAARIEVQMGTLGKALGSAGGFICGSRALIDLLINGARSFVFSTAPVPAAAAAARAAIEFVRSDAGDERRNALWARVGEVPGRFKNPDSPLPTAILPLLTYSETKAVEISAWLQNQGLFVPAIRYPTVPRGRARLRVSLGAAHSPANVARLVSALAEVPLQKEATPDAPPR